MSEKCITLTFYYCYMSNTFNVFFTYIIVNVQYYHDIIYIFIIVIKLIQLIVSIILFTYFIRLNLKNTYTIQYNVPLLRMPYSLHNDLDVSLLFFSRVYKYILSLYFSYSWCNLNDN